MQAFRAVVADLEKPEGLTLRSQEHRLALTPSLREKDRLLELQTALAETMLDRGEDMDDIRLVSYSKALAEEFADSAPVLQFLKRHGRAPREEFEPKILALADLVAAVRRSINTAVWAEKRAARVAKEREDEQRIAAERAEYFAGQGRTDPATEIPVVVPVRRANLQGWTAGELRALADRMDELAAKGHDPKAEAYWAAEDAKFQDQLAELSRKRTGREAVAS